ncbi:hypothetical protein PM082_011356 [Marasmius tenuissimus]|nr:hypothetical protein PM082_011356 [Marasmius tenuissimus]
MDRTVLTRVNHQRKPESDGPDIKLAFEPKMPSRDPTVSQIAVWAKALDNSDDSDGGFSAIGYLKAS